MIVLVFGVGIFGIVVGKIFSDLGIKNFIILEGIDRIGGRMRKMVFYNIIIEFGVNWI